MKKLWEIYYKYKLKDNYDNRLLGAGLLSYSTNDATNARISHFYNVDGEQIRGWAKRQYK